MTQLLLGGFPPAAPLWRCIASDPPWAERGGGAIKRGADRHYPVLSYAEIVDVHRTYFRDVGGVRAYHDERRALLVGSP